MMMIRKAAVGVAAAAAVLVAAACGGGGNTPSSQPPSAKLPEDPYAIMEVAFEGYPSKMQIRERMEPAMRAVGTPITNENLNRSASALVALRKQYGVSEMDMLECIPSRAKDPRITAMGYEVNMGTVAAVCSTDILEGRYQAPR